MTGDLQAGGPASGGQDHFLSLLSEEPPSARAAGDQAGNRSYARDLNLDQIVTAVAGDREERDLITTVLYGRLRDAGAVRYRQEVFRDLEDPALLDAVQQFSGLMVEVRAHLRQLGVMRYRYQREGWLLDAAAIYCAAVASLAAHLASAPVSSRALLAFRDYLASYVASAGFTALAADTRNRKDALAQIRYCTRIHGGRVEVSRYTGEADYSAAVLRTFDRFKQGAAKDYLIRYRTQPGMNHVAAQILELVARLFPEEFTALDEYCRQHAGFADEGIQRADQELQFYLAFMDYIRPLRAAGLWFCYPEVSASSKDVRVVGTFDLALAHKLVSRAHAGSHQRLPLGRPRAHLRRDRSQPGREDHLRPDLRPAPPPGRRRLPGPGQRRPAVPARPPLHPFRAGGGPRRDEREAGRRPDPDRGDPADGHPRTAS